MRLLEMTGLPARQRGLALLILVGIISMGVIFALVAGLNRSAATLAQERAKKTTAALAQAKEALIAYAVTYKDTHDPPAGASYTVPGYLPCPDPGPPTAEGQAAGSCGNSLVSVMGRLPWKTLGLDALKDGSGECLWYAVSGTYKNNPNGVSGSITNSNMMNWDTNGQFDVMDANGTSFLAGSTADTNAVAVIFAPGAALAGQNRTTVAGTTACGGNFNAVPPAAAYLDTANSINNSVVSGTASAPSTFIAGTGSDTFNDKLVYITRADIWNAIKKRSDFRSDFNNYLRAMTRLAAECIAMYGQHNGWAWWGSDSRLPWASNLSLSTVPTYAVNASYDDANTSNTGPSNLLAGRLPYDVNFSASQTNNDLNYSSHPYLFTDVTNSYCSYSADQQIWYNNWKDQLFYAVANNFRPTTSSSNNGNCPTCLKINGSGNYAAVVIFAGDKLTDAAGQVTQPRNTASDKGTIGNYLELPNSSNITAGTGGGNYQAAAMSSTFNDIVYAVDSNLTTIYCSDTSGVMRPKTLGSPSPGPPGNPKAYAACP